MKFTSILVLFLLVGVFVAEAEIKDKGLILYFSFDKADGGKVPDLTKGKHHGKLLKGKINKQKKVYGSGALEMKDPQSAVEVESFKELESYQDNSYLFWLYFIEGTNGSWSQIIAKKAPGSDRSPGIWICPAALGLHWRFNPGNQGSNCIGPQGEGKAFDLKKWVHVAGVKKKNQLIMYMDGKEKGKFGAPDKHAQGAEKLYIGRTGYRSATFIIDDLYVYDRAVKEAEVKKVMEGKLLPVDPKQKLTTTWGTLKLDAL